MTHAEIADTLARAQRLADFARAGFYAKRARAARAAGGPKYQKGQTPKGICGPGGGKSCHKGYQAKRGTDTRKALAAEARAARAAGRGGTAKPVSTKEVRAKAVGRIVGKSKAAAAKGKVATVRARVAETMGKAADLKARVAASKAAAQAPKAKAPGRGTAERASKAAAAREARQGVQRVARSTPTTEKVTTKGGVKTVTLSRGPATMTITREGDKFRLKARVEGKEEVREFDSMRDAREFARRNIEHVGYVGKEGSIRSKYDPPARGETRKANIAAKQRRGKVIGRIVQRSKFTTQQQKHEVKRRKFREEKARQDEQTARIKAEVAKESAARSALDADRRSRGVGPRPEKEGYRESAELRRRRILERAGEVVGEAREGRGRNQSRNLKKGPEGRVTPEVSKRRKDEAAKIKRARKAIAKVDAEQKAKLVAQKARAEKRRARQPLLFSADFNADFARAGFYAKKTSAANKASGKKHIRGSTPKGICGPGGGKSCHKGYRADRGTATRKALAKEARAARAAGAGRGYAAVVKAQAVAKTAAVAPKAPAPKSRAERDTYERNAKAVDLKGARKRAQAAKGGAKAPAPKPDTKAARATAVGRAVGKSKKAVAKAKGVAAEKVKAAKVKAAPKAKAAPKVKAAKAKAVTKEAKPKGAEKASTKPDASTSSALPKPPAYAGAKVSYGTDSEAQIRKSLEKSLGKGATPQHAAMLAGAPKDATSIIITEAHWAPGSIIISVNTPTMQLTRTLRGNAFNPKPPPESIYNDSFYLKGDVAKGTGIGTETFAKQVETAAASGVKRINTYAVRGGDANGYYTWARLGYDGNLSGLSDAAVAKLPAQHRGAKTVSELMKTPEGRAFWKENGVSTEMSFDLSPNSQSRKVLAAYQKERAARS